MKFRSLHLCQYFEFAFSIWGHFVFRQFRIFCRKSSSSNPFRLLLFLCSFGDDQKIISFVVVEPYPFKTATVKIYIFEPKIILIYYVRFNTYLLLFFYKKIWFLEVPLVPEVSQSAEPCLITPSLIILTAWHDICLVTQFGNWIFPFYR